VRRITPERDANHKSHNSIGARNKYRPMNSSESMGIATIKVISWRIGLGKR